MVTGMDLGETDRIGIVVALHKDLLLEDPVAAAQLLRLKAAMEAMEATPPKRALRTLLILLGQLMLLGPLILLRLSLKL